MLFLENDYLYFVNDFYCTNIRFGENPNDLFLSLSLELLANGKLTRTRLIYPHGLILSRERVDQRTLKQQVRQIITIGTLDIVPSSLGWICLWLWSVMFCECL